MKNPSEELQVSSDVDSASKGGDVQEVGHKSSHVALHSKVGNVEESGPKQLAKSSENSSSPVQIVCEELQVSSDVNSPSTALDVEESGAKQLATSSKYMKGAVNNMSEEIKVSLHGQSVGKGGNGQDVVVTKLAKTSKGNSTSKLSETNDSSKGTGKTHVQSKYAADFEIGEASAMQDTAAPITESDKEMASYAAAYDETTEMTRSTPVNGKGRSLLEKVTEKGPRVLRSTENIDKDGSTSLKKVCEVVRSKTGGKLLPKRVLTSK